MFYRPDDRVLRRAVQSAASAFGRILPMNGAILGFMLGVGLSTLVSAKPAITIGDQTLFLAYASADPSELREYLPQGESLSRWTRLASVRVFRDLDDPNTYLKNVAAAVVSSHPLAKYQVLEEQETKALILDFVTFAPSTEAEQFAEWNLMRASYVKGKGLRVFQYAMRIYHLGLDSGQKVNAERARMVQPFAKSSFQEVDITASERRVFSAADAIAAVREAPSGVEGVFEMVVRNSGRDAGWVYLNSEPDYRDSNCLTVAMPDGVAVGLKATEDNPAGSLRNKRVRVSGKAERVTIWFYWRGVKTDRSYYQTHIKVSDLSQIEVVE